MGNNRQIILKSFSCGNDTLMNLKGSYSYNSYDSGFEDFDFSCEYELYECPVCHEPTLYSTYTDETMVNPSINHVECEKDQQILYPINQISSDIGIPQKVKNAYEAALKVKNIDLNICLMALRRTLELILKDQGAKK